MGKTVTSRYDVAEHLRTPEEMAAYLEACLEEADGDAAFVAKALGDLGRSSSCRCQRVGPAMIRGVNVRWPKGIKTTLLESPSMVIDDFRT